MLEAEKMGKFKDSFDSFEGCLSKLVQRCNSGELTRSLSGMIQQKTQLRAQAYNWSAKHQPQII